MTYYLENIFICLTVPLLLSLLFRQGKQKSFTIFVIIGMGICLLTSYVSGFFAGFYGVDAKTAVMEITPVCEEVMKLLPLLMYLFIFEPGREEIIAASIGIAAGFTTFENVCSLIENGAANFYYILIRGVSAGALHILCGIALGCGIGYMLGHKWVVFTGTIGSVGACVVFHGIYNVLISSQGYWKMAGYLFPILLIFTLFVMEKIQFFTKLAGE